MSTKKTSCARNIAIVVLISLERVEMPRYRFKVDPCPPQEGYGYGWVQRYFEDDWEIPGYDVFAAPHVVGWMKRVEYENAKFAGELWVKEMIATYGGDSGGRPESKADSTQLSFKLDEW